MTSRGLMDTNVVILLNNLNPAELPEEMVISSITMAELAVGPHYAIDPVERAVRIERLQDAEALFEYVPFGSGKKIRSYCRGSHRRGP